MLEGTFLYKAKQQPVYKINVETSSFINGITVQKGVCEMHVFSF